MRCLCCETAEPADHPDGSGRQWWIARHTASGVNGWCDSDPPTLPSASLIAFDRATLAPMTPPSDIPFIPPGVRRFGWLTTGSPRLSWLLTRAHRRASN
jgi:hypothetical protein